MESTLTIQPVNKNYSQELVAEVINDASASTGTISTGKPFIQANTSEATIEEIRKDHILPVFIKDNEPLISHADFIDATSAIANEIFQGEQILQPSIRLSHPIKGRLPEAKDKPAIQLQDWERTIYYERMAFIIEIPSISDFVGGSYFMLSLKSPQLFSKNCFPSLSKLWLRNSILSFSILYFVVLSNVSIFGFSAMLHSIKFEMPLK